MKKILLPALLAFTTTGLSAQTATETTPAPKQYDREIGLFGQSQVNGSGENILGIVGLQYRKQKNEHLSMRLLAGYGQYNSFVSKVHHISGDTLYKREERMKVSMPVVGFGLEAQRHFFKNISLFAAVELKGGYGKGTGDTAYSKLGGFAQPGTEVYGNRDSYDASLLFIGATASIGARVQLNRFSMALELMPVQMSYLSKTGGTNSGGSNFDMTMGTFSQRLTLGWKF